MPQDLLQRYLRHRRFFEPLIWVALLTLLAVLNTAAVWQEQRRAGSGVPLWELVTWEGSSHLAWLALLPLMLAVLARWPLYWGVWRRHLPIHALAAVGVSLAHTVLMVALRKVVYAAQGAHYDFGDWPRELLYEGLKDVRSYAFIVTLALAYRLLLWRLQGEARVLGAPDEADEAPAPQPPQRLLVRKLGKEFLIGVDEIEWVQAMGNYVNLHRRGHAYPLRATLTATAAQLGDAFVRVHRSHLVRLALIEAIEPTEAGDALLRLQGGASVPCSRSHLEGLRARWR
ncbi:MAG: LytTR family transcriptional regulator DNA-binding domain-containing protein [Proteobacteria bacterium]|nr:LytTR family transcriptional regulator DNA-binding domain-containing protein [Pseudomonadota bacterium]